MEYDPDNIFAKIIRGDMPSVKVFEDDETLSFMDVFPQTRGHTLVVPKTAGVDLLNTEDDHLAAALRTTRKVARAIDAALRPDGIVISQFNRPAAGQTVFHTHFHILPRWEGQALGRHGADMADMTELKQLAELIKAEL